MPQLELKELQAQVVELQRTVTAHEVRLEGGARTFENCRETDGNLSDRIATVEEQIAPKRPNYPALIALVFSITMGLAAALWGLSVLFASRPTTEQIGDIIDAHEAHPHPESLRQINDLRDRHAELARQVDKQTTAVEANTAQMTRINKSLDKLVKRRGR